MQPRAGLFETLDVLQRNGFRIGMITNGWTWVQNATINALKVRDYMETIVISEAAGNRKPDAGIFKIALDALEIRPEQTCYVGDHPYSDMLGAANAGITGIWVRSGGHRWPDDLAKPPYIIDNLIEILDLLSADSG